MNLDNNFVRKTVQNKELEFVGFFRGVRRGWRQKETLKKKDKDSFCQPTPLTAPLTCRRAEDWDEGGDDQQGGRQTRRTPGHCLSCPVFAGATG